QFDAASPNWNPGHRGVDLAGRPGQPVYAAGSATVVFAGLLAGRPVVSLAHPGGLRTSYEPVVAQVRVGQPVSAPTV
ncbi:M23 family metallopeptidase, partial [Mycobacterium tuberculosis]